MGQGARHACGAGVLVELIWKHICDHRSHNLVSPTCLRHIVWFLTFTKLFEGQGLVCTSSYAAVEHAGVPQI